MEEFFLQLVEAVDITAGFNPRNAGGIFVIAFLAEFYIQAPLVLESLWLLVGYQSKTNYISLANSIVLLVAAQTARQMAMLLAYNAFLVINNPLSKLYRQRLVKSNLYKKYLERQGYFDAVFTPIPVVFTGMLTPLNGPIKVMLIVRRKLRHLMIGTWLSGMTFDTLYLVLGAIFESTGLRLTYLPVFLLFAPLLLIIKMRMTKWYSARSIGSESS